MARSTPVAVRPAPVPEEALRFYRSGPGTIWAFLRTQPASYWLVCIYLFFEYVRPQGIYEAIAFFPWAFWVIIVCLVAFLLEGHWFRLDSPADWLLGVFTVIVLLSSVFGYSFAASRAHLNLYLSWVVIYLLISNIVVTEKRLLVFTLSFLLYNLKMSLFSVRSWAHIGFKFRDWGVMGAPGFFSNSGELGIEMVIFIAVSFFFVWGLRPYWSRHRTWVFLLLPLTATVGCVASSSRGALLGAAAVGLWIALKSRYKVRTLVLIAVLAVLVIAIIPPEQKARFAAMGSDNTSVGRITYWQRGLEMLSQHPVLGIGYFSWMDYYTAHYAGFAQLPHNIFIQAASELGYSGLLVFVALIACTLVLNHRTRRLAARLPGGGRFFYYTAHGFDGALIGYLVSGFFVTVLYYPYFWVNLAMTVALHRAAKRSSAPAAVPSRFSRRAGVARG